jgi:hypothetical protein
VSNIARKSIDGNGIYSKKGSAHCEVDGLSLFLSGYNSAEEMII